MPYRNDLRAVRIRVTSYARQAGLTDKRTADLELAASEAAANTLRHAGGAGTLRLWHTPHEIVCEITDPGHIQGPLAGRRRPAHDRSGHGLSIVNQLCDLVELRTGPQGTTIRMHITRSRPRSWPPPGRHCRLFADQSDVAGSAGSRPGDVPAGPMADTQRDPT
ncbi:MAG: ATP-binding protein [Streptosporangiaceae bacterium]